MRHTEYTIGEEIANSVTHGIGAALGIAALVILVTFAGMQGDGRRVMSFSVYGAMLIVTYLSSTLYHGFPWPRVKNLFRVFDHSSIYLLIAGTYTPVALIHLRGAWGWAIFGSIWCLAVCGVLLKAFGVSRFRVLPMVLYVAMGWMIVVAARPLANAVPLGGIIWLVAGGLAYTLGLAFYALPLRYSHMVWHLFVLAGSICHFFCFLFYTLWAHT